MNMKKYNIKYFFQSYFPNESVYFRVIFQRKLDVDVYLDVDANTLFEK
jgi:hypothetical protein